MYTCLAVLLSLVGEYPGDTWCYTTSLHQTLISFYNISVLQAEMSKGKFLNKGFRWPKRFKGQILLRYNSLPCGTECFIGCREVTTTNV